MHAYTKTQQVLASLYGRWGWIFNFVFLSSWSDHSPSPPPVNRFYFLYHFTLLNNKLVSLACFFSFFLMFHLLCTDGVNIYTINSLHFTPFHLSPTYSPISLPAVSAQSGVTLLLIIEDQRQCHRHLMVNYASRSIVSAPAHSLSPPPPPTPHTLLDIYFRLFYHA